MKASVNTIAPVLFIIPLRFIVYRKTIGKLEEETEPGSIYTLPWKEFVSDFAAWLIAGALIVCLYSFYFGAPFFTGVKIMLACICFGLFGGILSYLATEKKIIDIMKGREIHAGFGPKRLFTVSTKMRVLMVSVLVFMAASILLMVFMDIRYLLSYQGNSSSEIYFGVFKEILFAFSVLVLLSLVVLTRYSRNMKSILGLQLGVMEDITMGRYDAMVPVVSNDEFGMIAAKTNDMIKGLKERDACQISFGKYVTPEVSEMILKGEISPEGALVQVTMLFCDLRGYTPFVERKDPKEVVRFLNEYFTEMEQAVRSENGIVLQYIGDEIEAVFGAPVNEPNHAEKAVRAALEMSRRLSVLNEERKGAHEGPVRHGIGIHTGMVLAGSVGSPDRLVYAMVGDTVNLASRIQGLNKTFETEILISETTKGLLDPGQFDLESMGFPSIRGKSEKIEIFRLL